MKVLHLISGGDVGGAKTHVLSLLHGLGKTEQVRLVCFREGEFAEDARKLGIDTVVMEASVQTAIGRLAQMIRAEGFQIVHCHGARANLTGAVLRRKIQVPIVTTVHSDYRLDYLGRPLHRLTYGTINTVALRMFDYHIGVSDAMAQLLISRGFDPQTMFAIYNGIGFSPVVPKLDRQAYLRSVGMETAEDTVHRRKDPPQYPPAHRGRRRAATDAGKAGCRHLPARQRRVCGLGHGYGQLLPCA